MQHARSQQEGIEMSLREHLLAASGSGPAQSPYPPPTASGSQVPENSYPPAPNVQSPHDQQIDPNVSGQSMYDMSGDPLDNGAERKGKRELSTSKRAAQNRAAQRAFRQRKEGYIKKLEEQVKDFQTMEQNYKTLQNENYQLREYILNLQSRLLENQADFPPAPSHVNLSAAPTQESNHTPASEPSYGAEQQLRREMEQRPQPPPPALVIAREDPPRDGLAQLHEAATQQEARLQSSPYGLGRDYTKRPTAESSAPMKIDTQKTSA